MSKLAKDKLSYLHDEEQQASNKIANESLKLSSGSEPIGGLPRLANKPRVPLLVIGSRKEQHDRVGREFRAKER